MPAVSSSSSSPPPPPCVEYGRNNRRFEGDCCGTISCSIVAVSPTRVRLIPSVVPRRVRNSLSDGYTVLGDEEVVTKFGVKPSSLPDLFGLVGDVADNIPGETLFLSPCSSLLHSCRGIFFLYIQAAHAHRLVCRMKDQSSSRLRTTLRERTQTASNQAKTLEAGRNRTAVRSKRMLYSIEVGC